MGLWSRIKSVAKKAVRVVKAVVRAVARAVIAVVSIATKIWDLVLGFLAWPPKRMRVHIVVLRGPNGPLIGLDALTAKLGPSIEILKQAYKDHCNVTVLPYNKGDEKNIETWVTILEDVAPTAALQRSGCSLWKALNEEETGDAGEYYRKHLAGWVGGVPISLAFPITVFVVESIGGYFGCTTWFLSDYVLVTVQGIETERSTIAHEIGHRCNIPTEHDDPKYLMFSGAQPNEPPYRMSWWHKNVIRSSRHVTYLFGLW